METILVKIFATALALSQVTTTPAAIKTQFDRVRDQEQVAELLHAGCTHMRKAFDIEDINLEELIATAMDDPQAVTGENKAFRGINFADLQTAYRQFCKNEKVAVPVVDLGDVIDFYNKATAELPDHTKLKGLSGRERRARPQGGTLRGGIRGEPAAGVGSSSPTSPSRCKRLFSRPRTSASISIRGSTSAA
jgi:hypothetical protein